MIVFNLNSNILGSKITFIAILGQKGTRTVINKNKSNNHALCL